MSDKRDRARREMGLAGIMPVSQACRDLLPFGEAWNRAYFHRHGLVRHIDGKPVVVVLDVLEHVRGSELDLTPPLEAPAKLLPRVKLT